MASRRTYYRDEEKTCEHCGSSFSRPYLSPAQWRKTRFCSRTCAAQVIHRSNAWQRFEENVRRAARKECWPWRGTIGPRHGYGQIKVNGVLIGAHRLSYELHYGKIPVGQSVLHKCDNRRCVNPQHLFLGTHSDNVADAVAKRRHAHGVRQPMAKLTDRAVIAIRKSKKTDADLAIRYRVSRTAVRNARLRRTWRHVP